MGGTIMQVVFLVTTIETQIVVASSSAFFHIEFEPLYLHRLFPRSRRGVRKVGAKRGVL